MKLLTASHYFNTSWYHSIFIGLALLATVAGLMVLIQPFDTRSPQSTWEFFALSGYGFVAALSYLLVHGLERIWYKQQKYTWFVGNELISLILFFLIVTTISNFYHSVLFMKQSKGGFEFFMFYVRFALPFCLIFAPILLFLRQAKKGKEIKIDKPSVSVFVEIEGNNQNEKVSFNFNDFYYAAAQQNYVMFVIRQPSGDFTESMIRATLKDVSHQFPQATRVHRSYLVNPAHIDKVQGSKRKQRLLLNDVSIIIPVSETFQEGLQQAINDNMSSHPKKD